jgi:ubiquitin C
MDIQVFVKTLHGKTNTMNVNTLEKVRSFKYKLGKLAGIRCDDICILLHGRYLQDHMTIGECHIEKYSTLDMSLRLRGGFLPIVSTSPDVVAVDTATETASLTQRATQWVKDVADRVKTWIEEKRQWYLDFMQRNAHHIARMTRIAFMFANFMRMMFQFFALIILARMIIGFFSKPLEFIMLGISCIVLAVTYVVYYILSVPPFIYIPFLIWFIIFDLAPLIVYTIAMGALFVAITILCILLAAVNFFTGGALKSLVLCQNHAASWFKTPNYHLSNKYERGLFCSRQCFSGYFPDATGMYCIRVPKGNPSYCPQAEVMRMYTGNRNDRNFSFKDYQTSGNIKYLSKSPEDRELMLKKHYLQKRDFMEKCDKSMDKFDYMSLNLCSSIDVMEKNAINGIDKKTVDRMKTVCAQAYCTSRKNYAFCPQMSGSGEDDAGEFWKRVMRHLIAIITFVFIVLFSLGYMLGVTLGK